MSENNITFIKRLSKLPKKAKKDFHYWADYIEILCLVNKDGIISQTDFIDRLKAEVRDIEDSEEYDKSKRNYEINERATLFVEDCFRILESRVSAFNLHYPFSLSEGNKSLHLKSACDLKQKIYFFLLFSSNLGYFNMYKNILTSTFELVSLASLKHMLPVHASSFIFGSSNIEKIEDADERLTLFWDKLQDLATVLKENVIINKQQLSKYNKGDGGLDLVAWIDLGDGNKHFPLYFCQCACTPEWNVKQNSSKFDRWNNFMSFSTYPLNFIFIPYSFRSATGEWHEEQLIEKSILIDRQRLLRNFEPYENEFLAFDSNSILDEILLEKESTV